MPSFALFVIIFLISKAAWSSKHYYIYDWQDTVNRYANFSDRPHHGHGVEFPQWKFNFGAGRLINANNSEFKTSQFALFKLIYDRALIDKRRTLNPTKAVSYFIPYDFGMDATFFEANGRMRRTQCPLAETVIKYLKQSPHFAKHHGHDHTLVVAVNQNMNYFFNAHPCINLLLTCWNCTKVAIDEYMFIAKDRKLELKKRGINWHAVPFPADYHYNIVADPQLALENSAALLKTNQFLPPWERSDKEENRTIVVSFLGNPRKYSQLNTLMREALVIQCKNHSEFCSVGAYAHDAKERSDGPNGESRRAVFCLQPPGDMPTRKSVFDSALSGCIPVLFHPLTARYMYEWHLGQRGWEDISINFDTQEQNKAIMNQTLDVIQALSDIYQHNPALVRAKRQNIRELVHQLQFSLIVHNNRTGRAEVCTKQRPDGSTTPDHFDVTMDHLLDIHGGLKNHDRTAEYLSCAQLKGGFQTADECSTLHTTQDPFHPPSVISPLYRYQAQARKTT